MRGVRRSGGLRRPRSNSTCASLRIFVDIVSEGLNIGALPSCSFAPENLDIEILMVECLDVKSLCVKIRS